MSDYRAKLPVLPDRLRGLPLVVNVSGGKDSAAVVLALREAGIAVHSYVFADTGWEHPDTYAHLATIERVLGIAIVRVGAPGGMVARAETRAGFPSRMQRWCTRELKTQPIARHLAAVAEASGAEPVAVVGNRADESNKRSLQPEVEPEGRDGVPHLVWRPIRPWTVEDVIRAHLRHGLPMNPLYHRGFSRVGCYPCIFSQKGEMRLLAELNPERIDEIRELEARMTAMRAERNAETPGRYKHARATFFQGREPNPAPSIDDVVDWSRTSRGGRQLPLLQEPPEGGCYRWGLCEAAPIEETE